MFLLLKDTTDGKNLKDVNYRIYKGDYNYREDMGSTLNDTRLEPVNTRCSQR